MINYRRSYCFIIAAILRRASGKREKKRRAATGAPLSPDFAVMAFNDLFADRQALPCARIFRVSMQTLKQCKDVLGMFRVEADAMVFYGEQTIGPSGGNSNIIGRLVIANIISKSTVLEIAPAVEQTRISALAYIIRVLVKRYNWPYG